MKYKLTITRHDGTMADVKFELEGGMSPAIALRHCARSYDLDDAKTITLHTLSDKSED